MIGDGKKLGVGRQWLSPFKPRVLGGLRGKINQFTDGSGTTLTPKRQPKVKRFDGSGVLTLLPQPPTPPPVCIPVSLFGVVISPPDDPLTLGTFYTVSTDPAPPDGTAPFNYQWFMNGGLVGSGATISFTLSDGDIQNKDETGLGKVFIYVTVSNACGIDSSSPDGAFDAQGTPPP